MVLFDCLRCCGGGHIGTSYLATYGGMAKLDDLETHADALSMHSGELRQGAGHHITHLMHIFVDTTPTATVATAKSQPKGWLFSAVVQGRIEPRKISLSASVKFH